MLPLALFLVLAGYFVISLRPNHDIHELPSAMIEKPAPAFDLAGLDTTKSLDLNALKGHPLVINFFASWCVPCRIEHPLLMRLAEQNHLPLYGIAYKDKPADSTRLLATFGDPYRQVGVDLDGRVGLNFGVYGVPGDLCHRQLRRHPQAIRRPLDRRDGGQGSSAAAQAA